MTEEIKYIVSACLQNDRSPGQITGRLRKEGAVSLHHETVYQYILTDKTNGGQFYRQLRQKKHTGNAADQLSTVRGYPIAETSTNARPRLTPESVSVIGKPI